MFTTQGTPLTDRLIAVMGTAHLIGLATNHTVPYAKREATLTHALRAALHDGDAERVRCIENALDTLRAQHVAPS